MNTKIIPTAEEFLRKNIDYVFEKDCKEDVENAMIEFAKLHVESALKEAAYNLDSEYCYAYSSERNKHDELYDSILKSYPLENIK